MSQLLADQLSIKGIINHSILAAIAKVPRQTFVEDDCVDLANEDTALPIAHNQTISQPYVVARMTELLLEHYQPQTVLEIGTGSGYQAAILAELIEQVYSIERIQPLYQQAKKRLRKLGYQNIQLLHADGTQGWPAQAPYDAIIITAATDPVPQSLLSQLSIGGKLVVPLGEPTASQRLCVINKTSKEDYQQTLFDDVIFVPLLPGTTTD